MYRLQRTEQRERQSVQGTRQVNSACEGARFHVILVPGLQLRQMMNWWSKGRETSSIDQWQQARAEQCISPRLPKTPTRMRHPVFPHLGSWATVAPAWGIAETIPSHRLPPRQATRNIQPSQHYKLPQNYAGRCVVQKANQVYL